MSENQSPTPSSDSQDVPFQPSLDGVNCSPDSEVSTSKETSGVAADSPSSVNSQLGEQQDSEQAADVWETVALPGTLGEAPSAAIEPPTATADSALSPDRENELLTLIHDLNECNDALLARTSQLEEALEATRLALAAEIEKARAAHSKMTSQISAEQATAQQTAQNAQQQVAKLVSQLDVSEQACSRQHLIIENLQTELSNCQERIVQLEHECAVITQQHATEAQARTQAETTSRDLRSRLQRQQRYTLQFKAALEKSLSAKIQQPASAADHAEQPQSAAPKEPVPMPRAQRIMPWASGSAAAFQGIDPHLESLIRGASQPADVPAAPAAASDYPTTAADQEAEAALWQDLERVMKASEAAPSPPEEETTKDAVDAAADKVAAQSPRHSQPTPHISVDLVESNTAAEDTVPAELDAIAPAVASSFAAATGQRSDAETRFVEPSPWGNPLPMQPPEMGPETDSGTTSATGYLPVKDDAAAVSPLVRPTRSPKKLGSLSAVQLPTFKKAKASSNSFQR